MKSTRTARAAIIAGALATLLVASACSSSSSSGGPSGTTGTSGSGGSSAAATSGGAPSLATLYKGSYAAPPTSSPAGAKGKSVWWISCSQAVASCSDTAAAAGEAAKKLGLDFHIADGKFNVGGAFTTAINTALAAKPDAIILYGVACELVRGALQAAKAQNVTVMGSATPDCSEDGNGASLFNVHEQYTEQAKSAPDFWKLFGALGADYIINKSGGKAKIISSAGSEPLQNFVNEGFTAELKKCSGCSIVDTVKYDSSTLTPNGPWIQAFRASLAQHPEATAVYFPFEVFNSIGGTQAVSDSGHKLIVFGGQGDPTGLQLLESGKLDAIPTAESTGWSGYAAIDAINRALQGKPQVPEGVGFQLVDKDHNLPASGDYVPPIDYKAAYTKAWAAAS